MTVDCGLVAQASVVKIDAITECESLVTSNKDGDGPPSGESDTVGSVH